MLNVWDSWSFISNNLTNGLKATLVYPYEIKKKSDSLQKKLDDFKIMIFEKYENDPLFLKEFCRENGLPVNKSDKESIRRIINLKEYLLDQENDEINLSQEEIFELYSAKEQEFDKKIKKLHKLLKIMQKSYSQIKVYDYDGVEIHPYEYGILQISSNGINKTTQNKNIVKLKENKEYLNTKEKGEELTKYDEIRNLESYDDDDIEGEPL